MDTQQCKLIFSSCKFLMDEVTYDYSPEVAVNIVGYSLRCEAEICVSLNNGPKLNRKIWLSSQCWEITDELKSGSTLWRAKPEGLSERRF